MIPVLDRRIPTDWQHVEKHPLRLAQPQTFVPLTVEKVLDIPRQYRDEYDQGVEGKCVSFSQSWMMSILNRQLYDPHPHYRRAQEIDEWADTPPAEGTSVRAGFDVLRTIGHWRMYAGVTRAPQLEQGIDRNLWATSVDDIRATIASGVPVNLGLNWYRQFSLPAKKPRLDDQGKAVVQFGQERFDHWIGLPEVLWGRIDGGHAITAVAASDKREALGLCNTWGASYPFIVWLPYKSLERLLAEEGEAGLVVDRQPKAAV